ncbi:integrator complex subunit 14-like [Lineus longissimus]|uniref:integrator complex subunit 14-like n=1 Tax=Lineus longissimus TaxID=88925 RepID=UPI002B4CF5C0
MPTIILLDVSLSMSRIVPMPESTEEYQRRHLAVHGLNSLLDYIAQNNKLEFCSLVVFSSLWEQTVAFTRDIESVKTALTKVEEYDKTNVMSALAGVNSLVVDEWGASTPCQIILVTDGCTGYGAGSVQHGIQEFATFDSRVVGKDEHISLHRRTDFPLPFPFPSKIQIVCLANQNDPLLVTAIPQYQKLIDINGGGGEVYTVEGNLSLKSVQQTFMKVAEDNFKAFHGQLHCGQLECRVQLFPPPDSYIRNDNYQYQDTKISNEMEICGFIDIADVSSPPVISRHLVLPAPIGLKENNKSDDKDVIDVDEADDGKAPSFTVLLHGSLKVEGMVAIARVGDKWYGMLYSFADSKKKSNLMLSIFEPGLDAIPWLGKFTHLAPISDFSDPPYGEDDNKTPFPVRQERRSYATNSTVWIRATGLQADVQKILRHGRKLPEKQQHFYKELNRLRRMAVSLGFMELLDAMGSLLERECTLLPGSAHPDAALQLSHAASVIRSETSKEIGSNITPLRTNFTSDD